MKTTGNADENRGFRKRFQKWSLLKTVPEKASNTSASVSVFARFSVDDRRILLASVPMKNHEFHCRRGQADKKTHISQF